MSSSDFDTQFFVVQDLTRLHFFDDLAKVTPRVAGVTFSLVHLCHLLLCQHCACVHFRRARESQAKRCFHIFHIGSHRVHTAH